MLKCIVCDKVIANVDPSTVRYGGCSACDLKEVARLMEEHKAKEKRKDIAEFGIVEIVHKQSENPWDYLGRIKISHYPSKGIGCDDLEKGEQVIELYDKKDIFLGWFATDGKKFFAPICNDDFLVDTFDEALKILFKDWIFPEILATSPCSPSSGYEKSGA